MYFLLILNKAIKIVGQSILDLNDVEGDSDVSYFFSIIVYIGPK